MIFASLCTRVLALVLVGLTWSLAGAALASSQDAANRGHYRGECRRLTRQIDHYEGTVLPMAAARGNDAWERATEAQIDRLWNRRADLCPQFRAQRTLLAKAAEDARKFKDLVVTAGKAAATYFSGGLVP